jgi:hypothetical protein
MVLEHAGRERICYSQEERQQLAETRRPPEAVMVWLGRYSGRHASRLISDRRLTFVNVRDPSRIEFALISTIAVGAVALQIFCPPSIPEIRLGIGGLEAWANRAVQLWPLEQDSIHWPPPQALDDPLLVAFINRFISELNQPIS